MFCGQEKILYDLLYYIVQKIKFLTAAERFLSDTRILLNKKDGFYTECWGVLKSTLPTFFSL